MPKKSFNAFISYSRKDGVEFVDQLRERLRNDEKGKELRLWQDREQMEGDVGWWKQITNAIDNSEYLILVITSESLKSGVCQKEWRYARQMGVCVAPVKGVPDSQLDYDLLPGSMKNAHIYDTSEEWAKFVNDLCRSCQVKKVLFMAPDLPRDFVPRVELTSKIKQQLLELKGTDTLALTSALSGAGGFGKTTLAAALCHDEDIQDHFWAGILWATIGEEGNSLKEITKLYNAITNEDRHFGDKEEAARMLSERLEQGEYLLVIDDVWKYCHLEPFLIKAPKTVRLITTRVDEVARNADAALSQVNELKKHEAFQMLVQGWKVDRANRLIVEQLISEAGEWPLLLKLMRSAALSRIGRGESIRNTLIYLKENYSRKGLTGFDARDPESRNEAVSICIEASFKILGEAQRQQCIELGVFPTDTPIPTAVIYSLWDIDSFEGEDILLQLDEYSLLNFNMDKKEVGFHDVMLHYYRHASKAELINKHKQLIQSWGDPYTLPNMYAWQFYLWHLKEAREYNKIEKLLLDYDWIKGKLEKTGVHAILADYSLVTEGSRILQMIHKALRMSAHILAANNSNLAFQLSQRLRFHSGDLPPAFNAALNIDLEQSFLLPIQTSMLPVGSLNYTLNYGSAVVCCIIWQSNSIIGLDDGRMKIISNKDGRELQEFKGHTYGVTCLAVTGETLVSSSWDHTLRSWDLSTGNLLQEFKGHTSGVTCIAVAGEILVSGSKDHTLRSWDLSTGNSLQEFKGHTSVVTCLAIAGEILVSGSSDNTLRSWDLSTGNPSQEFQGHSLGVTCLAVGEILVSGSGDNTLRSWDLSTGNSLQEFKGHIDLVTCLAVAGEILVSGSWDNTLRSWDLFTGNPLQEFKGHTSWVHCLAVAGEILVSGSRDNSLRSWNLSTGNALHEFNGHTRAVTCLTVEDKVLVSGSHDNTLRSWDLSSGNLLQESKGHTGEVTCLALAGEILVSGSEDNTLRSWGLSTGNPLQVFKGHTHQVDCLGVYGEILVSSSWDHTLRSWDLLTSNLLQEFKGHTSYVTCLTIAGEVLVSGSVDNSLRSWNLSTGNFLQEFKGHTRAVTCLTVANEVLVSGSHDNTLRSWDLSSGNLLQEFKGHTGEVTCLALAGEILVSGSRDNTLRSWNLSTGNPLQVFKGHTSVVTCLALASEILVSGSRDSTLRSWNLFTGNLLQEFKGHIGNVTCLAVAGGILVSGSHDNTLRSWDLSNAESGSCVFIDEAVSAITIDCTKKIIVVGAGNGGIYFFRVNDFY